MSVACFQGFHNECDGTHTLWNLLLKFNLEKRPTPTLTVGVRLANKYFERSAQFSPYLLNYIAVLTGVPTFCKASPAQLTQEEAVQLGRILASVKEEAEQVKRGVEAMVGGRGPLQTSSSSTDYCCSVARSEPVQYALLELRVLLSLLKSLDEASTAAEAFASLRHRRCHYFRRRLVKY